MKRSSESCRPKPGPLSHRRLRLWYPLRGLNVQLAKSDELKSKLPEFILKQGAMMEAKLSRLETLWKHIWAAEVRTVDEIDNDVGDAKAQDVIRRGRWRREVLAVHDGRCQETRVFKTQNCTSTLHKRRNASPPPPVSVFCWVVCLWLVVCCMFVYGRCTIVFCCLLWWCWCVFVGWCSGVGLCVGLLVCLLACALACMCVCEFVCSYVCLLACFLFCLLGW